MKRRLEIDKFRTCVFPKLVALVTSIQNGKPNIITVAWHSPISIRPPLYGISVSPARYSHDLILEGQELVVNFPGMDILDQVHLCGRISGREGDKFEQSGLTAMPSSKVDPPLIKECYAHLECKVFDKRTLGDHTWITGEVVAVHADDGKFEDGLVRNVEPVLYLGKNTYTTITDVRKNLRSKIC